MVGTVGIGHYREAGTIPPEGEPPALHASRWQALPAVGHSLQGTLLGRCQASSPRSYAASSAACRLTAFSVVQYVEDTQMKNTAATIQNPKRPLYANGPDLTNGMI